jgi:hypothetical protein
VQRRHFKGWWGRNSGLLAFAGYLFWHSAIAAAQHQPVLDGTWRLDPSITRLVPVGGRDIPFTRQGRTDYHENRTSAAKGDFDFDQTRTACSSPGLPRLMLIPDRFRIFQRERVVTMLFEWNRQFRQIDMQGGAHERPPADSMNGVSYGRWEGDILVVNSLGFLPGKLLDNALPSSESLELLERIRLKDNDTLEDLVTITDPVNFTRPWQADLTYKRQPDEQFPEDLCLDRMQESRPVLPR